MQEDYQTTWQCHALHLGERERLLLPSIVLEVVVHERGALEPAQRTPSHSLGLVDVALTQLVHSPSGRLRLLAPLGVIVELRWQHAHTSSLGLRVGDLDGHPRMW